MRENEIKVKLEDGVWLADFDQGYPPTVSRTCYEEHAKIFSSIEQAGKALKEARKFRPFEHAKIYGWISAKESEAGDERS
jgi:hypothetical protein